MRNLDHGLSLFLNDFFIKFYFLQLEDCTRRSINDILEYVSDGHTEGRTKLLLCFSCDGAKLTKKINSVRGVFKILHPRDSLPASIDQLSMSPDDITKTKKYIM